MYTTVNVVIMRQAKNNYFEQVTQNFKKNQLPRNPRIDAQLRCPTMQRRPLGRPDHWCLPVTSTSSAHGRYHEVGDCLCLLREQPQQNDRADCHIHDTF